MQNIIENTYKRIVFKNRFSYFLHLPQPNIPLLQALRAGYTARSLHSNIKSRNGTRSHEVCNVSQPQYANVCVCRCMYVCVCSTSRSLSLMPLRMHARACTFVSYVHVHVIELFLAPLRLRLC